PDLILFDSALAHPALGRYSFLTADPIERVRLNSPSFGIDPFAELRRELPSSEPVAGLPPFQGGWAGLTGYELGRCWERVPAAAFDDFQIPVLCAGLYDWVIAWDHAADRAWIVAQGWGAVESVQRAATVNERLESAANHEVSRKGAEFAEGIGSPRFAVAGFDDLWSNFSKEKYLRAVERVIEYIVAGDIFQANLTQRLLMRAPR